MNYNEIITKDHIYYSDVINVTKPRTKYLTNVLTNDYPQSLFVSGSYKLWPNDKYTLEQGAIDLKKLKYTNLHWGQRKLLLTEIDFLTDFIDKNKKKTLVIYAGAADGRHTSLLSELFPGLIFHVYDPRKFHPSIHKSKNIVVNHYHKIHNIDKDYGFFTSEIAKYYSENIKKDYDQFLFISDIRVIPDVKFGHEDYTLKFQDHVVEDQAEQARWVKIMSPDATMIKFKTPYALPGQHKYYKYLNGEIRVQAWAGNTSTETRLIMTKLTDKYYDIILYERQVAYFNNQMRLYDFKNTKIETLNISIGDFWSKYLKINNDIYGADYCLEIGILIKYLKKFNQFTLENLINMEKILNVHLIDNDKNFLNYLKK